MMTTSARPTPLFHSPIVQRAIVDSFKKLDPRVQLKNPVMFIVEIGSVLTTLLGLAALLGSGEPAWVALEAGLAPAEAAALARGSAPFILAIAVWLWFTVLFANFAEAMAEGRGKAQADSLRRSRQDVMARKLSGASRSAKETRVAASALRRDDVVLVEAGDTIPGDGEADPGRRLGRRKRHHGRERAGHPRKRRRSQRRHRRDTCALGLVDREDHG